MVLDARWDINASVNCIIGGQLRGLAVGLRMHVLGLDAWDVASVAFKKQTFKVK